MGDRALSGLADEAARRSIREELDQNILVEAGAGSGKTTSLVSRMVALVRSGACRVDEIAAVTFTRKAAAELRERFQIDLEAEIRELPPDAPGRGRLEKAIRAVDTAFLGTIHAFCARLLRERPLEAGLDPGFREIEEAEAEAMRKRFWVEFQEKLATDGDRRLGELASMGIPLERLEAAFARVAENPDVDFGFEPVAAPGAEAIDLVRARLDELLDRAAELMPDRAPARGWDRFAQRMRTLLYRRRAFDWSDPRVLADALSTIHRKKKGGLVQNRWSDRPSGKLAAKRLEKEVVEFAGPGGAAALLLRQVWAHRYPVAMGIARDAARAFAAQRKSLGRIGYQDLLVLASELLANEPETRRELGSRYPRVLVDEFQDTDPLQAEILLLLASDPETGDDWRRVEPRPGALFVVGDPKQSIYRFRRADIALYQEVKRRFEAFGKVLRLETNFRSLPAVGELVKGVFDRDGRFGARDSDRQAAFAPLRPSRSDEGPGLVAAYSVGAGRQSEVARDEAERVATAIAARVRAGEREPGDFMILTRTRRYLRVYARALERRSVAVDLSGAGVEFSDELGAFLLLLRCLEDPTHRTRAAGVLAGPLFGVALDELVAYRDGGGRFEINRPAAGDCEAAGAIRTLHEWWRRALVEPADVTVERLLAETGLIPLAAAEELGRLRTGAIAYLLDAVRARVLAGDASLAGAAEAIEEALEWRDAEAPLVPGRGDCVRVMNLHRAKGLEARVVFLASPFGERDIAPKMRVARDGAGRARGSIAVLDRVDPNNPYAKPRVIAQPLNWERERREESAFEAAERVRLLYVAATRAKDELWIARGAGLRGASPWRALEEWVAVAAKRASGARGAVKLAELARREAPRSPALDSGADVAPRLDAMRAAAERGRAATYRRCSVTERARGDGGHAPEVRRIRARAFAKPAAHPAKGGREWGGVVHRTLAAAAEGVCGQSLERLARDQLADCGRGLGDGGEPLDLGALMALVAAVRDSPVWARATASDECLVEVPFALPAALGGDRREVVEGVIDLVFREGDAWTVVDYKTDRGDDPGFESRVEEYRAQVDLYAGCWERLSGAATVGRVLVFAAQGRIESW